MTASVSIVVVTHRGAGPTLRACLESLAAAADRAGAPRSTTIVVDNGDGPDVEPTEYGPGVDEVIRTANRGFGAAANVGIEAAGARSGAPIAVLNDDVEVAVDWLAPLVDALTFDDRIGAVQPALLRLGTDVVNSLGVELDRFAAGSDVGIGSPAAERGAARVIDIFTGGAVLFRAEFIAATGGFDDRYFLYYEDVDLALRGRELGWTYRCETSSIVYHHGGATTSGLGDELVRYQERNRLWTAVRFSPPSTIVAAFWLSIRKLRHRPRAAHVRAFAEGLAGTPGAFARRRAARRLSPASASTAVRPGRRGSPGVGGTPRRRSSLRRS